MKLTKFNHACLVLEKNGTTLIIDPGVFSHDFIMPKKVDAVIITHEHPDHLDPKLVSAILKSHPKASIIAHESITSKFADSPTQAASLGQEYTVGSFTLQFFGGTHATIEESLPVPPNLGVLVDETFYYPGDSFTIPTKLVTILAPWLKFDLTVHFLEAINPQLAFPTHDAILSVDGQQLIDTMVGNFASSKGILYKRLDGSSVELS